MDILTYKCPNCGAPISFDIEKGMWHCHFCDSTFAKEESQQFEQQGGSETEAWSPEAFSDGETSVYECPNCGGQVLADQNTAATFCVYCHNPTVLSGRLKGEYRPARLIPFQLPKEHAVTALQKLCKGRPLLPKEFRECAEKGEVTGLYVPFWLFSADVNASLTASGKRIAVWSDSNYRYTKTDIYHIEREGNIPFRKVPVDASSRMDSALMDSIEPFHYDKLVEFSMEYLSGHFAENFDVDSKSSLGRFERRAREGSEQALRNTIKGYNSVDSVRVSANLQGTDCLYVMLPVWTVMIRYKGQTYTYAMNGQTGKTVGKLPISTARVLAWMGGLTAAFTAISFVGGMLL